MSAPIEDHVLVTITLDTVTVEQANFGTPMILAYVSPATQAARVATYAANGALTALVAAGFPTYSPVYKMAQALLSQSPKVTEFKVGRMGAHTQDVEVEILTDVEDDVVQFTITDELGVDHLISYTVLAAETLTTVAVAVAGLINGALANLTATPTVADIRCVADNPGEVFFYGGDGTTEGVTENINLTAFTAAPATLLTDMAAIALADGDWYAAGIDVDSFAITDALAGWFETERYIHFAQSQDAEIPTAGAGDIATELLGDSRLRTNVIFKKGPLDSYPAMAWIGRGLPKDPGSQTWAFKVLSGVPFDTLDGTELTNIRAKNCNHYIRIAGASITRDGKMAQGTFIDTIRLSDWIKARVEEALFDLMVSNDKLPYTDDTLNLVEAEIKGVYETGADNGGLILSDFSFTATKAAAQATADRDLRIMRGIQFGGTFTGAVHQLVVNGVIN